MPIPSSINDLSTTAASNYPSGSEDLGTADDYLRTYASYIAALRDVVLSGTANLSTANITYTGTLTGGTGVVNIGTLQIYKDASGNVGIGRSPTSKLDVNGPLSLSVPTYTAASAYTVLSTDSCIRFAATCTVTLPSAASCPGRILRLANVGAFAVTSASANVAAQDTGAAGTAILAATAGKWADIQSDGSFWYVTASR